MQKNNREISVIKERILEYLDNKGISKYECYQNTGITNGVLSQKSGISEDNILRFLSYYKDISYEWLLTGHGDMLKTDIDDKQKHILSDISKQELETRPRIPMDAAAGSLTMASDGVTINDCEQIPVIKAFARYDFTIVTRGDSMYPEYHSGDELACLFVKNTSFIQWGRVHVLDTAQGVVLKRIINKDEHILCRSINPDYEDFLIHKSEVYNIALVIGLVRGY